MNDAGHPVSVPSRQADEALYRLERDISFLESVIRSDEGYTETVIAQCIDAREDIATVRSELGRLRGEVVEWRSSIATEKLTWRAEAAEERARRLEDGLREARAAHLGDQRIANELVNHFPVEIRCDHEAGQDKVFCDCGRADLGWHSSVRLAKEAWAQHVIESVKAARALLAGADEPDGGGAK